MSEGDPWFGDEANKRFLSASFAELGLGMLAIVLGWLFGPNPKEHVPMLRDTTAVFSGVALGAAAGVALAALMIGLGRLPLRSIQELNRVSQDQFRSFLAPFSTPQLLTIALCAGVGEELLYRGWLQSFLGGPIGPDGITSRHVFGLVLGSLIFGFSHPITRSYIFIATLMGGIFGVLLYWSQNLMVPIIAHAVYDAIMMLLLLERLPIFKRDGS